MARTLTRRKASPPAEALHVRGFVRLQLVNRDGSIAVDKTVENAITANGFQAYIAGSFGAVAGSKQVNCMQVATQTVAPSSAQTSASGEFEARKTTSNSFIANGTMQATAQYATNEATQSVLGAVALYNTTSVGVGTAACVATFATSQKTTDQTLNITYQVRFA
jgi:hypothetical protein